MYERVKELISELKDLVGALDPEALDPRLAPRLVEGFSQVEKLGAAGKALAARRVSEGGVWRKEGDRTPAHFLSRLTGDSVGQAFSAIKTARQLEGLPKADRAFRRGHLTLPQAAEISAAASLAPQQEESLLKAARTEGLDGLRLAARRVVAAHSGEAEAARAERIHRSRCLRTFSDPDGAFRLEARLTPEAGAEVRGVLDVISEDLLARLRRRGEAASRQAAEADALVEMARVARAGGKGHPPLPKASMKVVVDLPALRRGHLAPGETCEAQGVGPIPVAAARAFLSDSFLEVVFTEGERIEKVARLGRTIPAPLRSAVHHAHPTCAVEGCRERKGLEIDHVTPLEKGGISRASNLVRLCSHHHRLKTYRGYLLKPRDGGWQLLPPPDKLSRAGPTGR